MIRKDNECPLGLGNIPKPCLTVGEHARHMAIGDNKRNRQIYKKVGKSGRCPFAEQLFIKKKAVNCDIEDSAPGIGQIPFSSGSPIYPRLWEGFNTINLDRQYHSFHGPFGWFSISGSKKLSRRDVRCG